MDSDQWVVNKELSLFRKRLQEEGFRKKGSGGRRVHRPSAVRDGCRGLRSSSRAAHLRMLHASGTPVSGLGVGVNVKVLYFGSASSIFVLNLGVGTSVHSVAWES